MEKAFFWWKMKGSKAYGNRTSLWEGPEYYKPDYWTLYLSLGFIMLFY